MSPSLQQAAPAGPWPPRFEMLEGIRGLAALGVVLAHLGIVAIGHFSVMVFFVISGYCITASANQCMRRGVGFADFMRRRIRRIYPPYLFALGLYAITRLVKWYLGGPNDLDRSLLVWIQNLTLTQWMSVPFAPIDWPSDNPTLLVAAFWSLNYEEQFYLVVALAMLAAVHARLTLAAVIAAPAVLAVVWNFIVPDGWVTGLFIEYFAHFALGSALYFTQCEATRRDSTWWMAAALGALAIACSIGILAARPGPAPRAFAELLSLCAFTAALLLLRPAGERLARHVLWRPVAALGTISYSLYLIHQFNLTLIERAVDQLPLQGASRSIGMVALMLVIATVFWYACERPFLNASLPDPQARTRA